MRLAVRDRDPPFPAYRGGYYDHASKRMVIEDIDGQCVVPGEPLAASLASGRWPADADTAAAVSVSDRLLDNNLYA